MRTTIELPDQLLSKAKSEAALKGVSLKMFFMEAIEAKLAGPPRQSRRFVPITIKEGPPIRRATREEVDEAMFG